MHLGAHFSHVEIFFFNLTEGKPLQFNSLLMILNVCLRSDLTVNFTLFTLSYVFEFELFPHEVLLPPVLGLINRTCPI